VIVLKKVKFVLLLLLLLISGCVKIPPPDMSWYSTPKKGYSGVYFYQYKTGLLGSGFDVKFILDETMTMAKINTGEWAYFEVPAGNHKYRFRGGIVPLHFELDFVENQNYFFRGMLLDFFDQVTLTKDTVEIKEVIRNIESGHYKKVQ